MREMGYFSLVLSSKVGSPDLFSVHILSLALNRPFLRIQHVLEPVGLRLEGLGELLHLLAFHERVRVSLVLDLFELALVDLGVLFDLQILLVDFLSQPVLPLNVSIQELLLGLVDLALQPRLLGLALGLQLLVALHEVVMLNLELVEVGLHLSLVPVEVDELFLELSDLRLKIKNVFFQYLLLGLDELGLFLLVLDVPLYLLVELELHNADPFIVLGLHVRDNLLIDGDHLVQRLLNPVALTLQVLDLVEEDFVGDVQLSPLAGLLLNLLEMARLSVQHMLRKLAGSEGEVEEGAAPVLLRRKVVYFFGALFFLPSAEQHLLHIVKKINNISQSVR